MNFRDYFAITVFLAIGIFGPIDHESEYGIVMRFCQVLLVPLSIWLFLGWLWVHEEIREKTDRVLTRVLSFINSFVFAAFALNELIYPSAWYDGVVRIQWRNVVLYFVIAGIFVRSALAKRESKTYGS